MHDQYVDDVELGPALELAQDKLDRFERQRMNRHVLVRLRKHSPLHPFLILRAMFIFLTGVAVVATVAVMAIPLLGNDFAHTIGQIDAMFSLTLPLVGALLATGFLLFGIGAHLAALVAGRSAPLLPHEARTHQRLVSDVKRLEAQQAVSARLTPSPTRSRMRVSP